MSYAPSDRTSAFIAATVFSTPYLPIAISTVSVSFDTPLVSVPGHITFVSPGQLVIQVPWELQKALAHGETAAQIKVSIGANSGAIYNLPLGNDTNWSNTFVWGQNNATKEGKTQSFLIESNYQRGRNTIYFRWEQVEKSGHELVRSYWQSQRPEKYKAFEALWETSLHDGLISGSALPAISVAPHADFVSLGKTAAASADDAKGSATKPVSAAHAGKSAGDGPRRANQVR